MSFTSRNSFPDQIQNDSCCFQTHPPGLLETPAQIHLLVGRIAHFLSPPPPKKHPPLIRDQLRWEVSRVFLFCKSGRTETIVERASTATSSPGPTLCGDALFCFTLCAKPTWLIPQVQEWCSCPQKVLSSEHDVCWSVKDINRRFVCDGRDPSGSSIHVQWTKLG